MPRALRLGLILLLWGVLAGANPVLGEKEEHTLTIVALGASNTEGYGVATAESYPAQLQALLSAGGLPARVMNAGISGDTTRGMLARLDQAVPEGTALVILQAGSNDYRYFGAAEREANIAEIRRRLAVRAIKLIEIDNALLREIPDTEMQSDGIHYTARGYRILAERLLPAVVQALAR
jgi:acyl-CoA thioesterase-1